MARIVGKDAMQQGQQLTLLCAGLVDDAFLRQSAFSATDRNCPPEKQIAMMAVLMRFFEVAEKAVAGGVEVAAIGEAPFFRRIARMGEEIGEDTDDFVTLIERMETEMDQLSAGVEHAL